MTSNPTVAAPVPAVFYGWRLVAVLFVIMVFTGGIGFYQFPVFVSSLHAELGWTITQISGAVGLWAIIFGLSGPLIGAAIARFGPRATMLAGSSLVAVTAAGFACMSSLWMFYALQVAAGCSCAATTLVPGQTLVMNWFNRYRGRAMALMMMGVGTGGFVLPPVYEFLIRAFGWRLAFSFSCAAIAAVVMPAIAFFVKDTPASLGLLPDGADTPDSSVSGRAPASGVPVLQAVLTVNFGLLLAIYLLQLVGISVLNFHFVPFASMQAGFTSQQSALFFGIALGCSVLGQFGFGWAADRFHPVLLQASTGVLMAMGAATIELGVIRMHSQDAAILAVYAATYGLGMGGQNVLLPLLVGQCFGALHFSRIIGIMMGGFALGILVGIPGAGWIYDSFHSYEPAFLACIGLFLISTLLALFIRTGRDRRRFVQY